MARLPIPGADEGTWGTTLNDYLSQSLASDGSLKANTVGGQQVADGALTQAKIQDLQSDLAAKISTTAKGAANGVAELDGGTKVPIAQLPTGSTSSTVSLGNHTHAVNNDPVTAYPLAGIGAFAASLDVDSITTGSSFGAAFFARIFIPANRAITSVGIYLGSAGTLGAGGENGFGVYDDSGNFVASTPSDNNLWTAMGWRSKAFTTPIAAQASDRFVYISLLINGYTVGINTLYGVGRPEVTDGTVGFAIKRRAFFRSTLTSWPASFDPATYGDPAGGYIPFIALA